MPVLEPGSEDSQLNISPTSLSKRGLQLIKGIRSPSPCHRFLFNIYSEHIMRNAGLDELQDEIKIGGRNINNLRYADDNTLMAEIKEEL